jgi:hypothetical protein
VVGGAARDGLDPLVLAARGVDLADDLPGRLDRLRAAAREERAAQAGAVAEALGELERGRRGDAPVRRERELLIWRLATSPIRAPYE